MKKLLAVLCTLAMLISMFGMTAMAEGEDLVITSVAGAKEGAVYKMMTITNNSDKELNLYDYTIGYAGKTDGSRIKELTEFAGGTDWVESTVLDKTKVPVNPAEAKIPAGETVVIWVYGNDSYGDGTAPKTVADFKAAWGLSAETVVICFDESTTGSDTNFKLNNKSTWTLMDLSVADKVLNDAAIENMNDGVDDESGKFDPKGGVGAMPETISFMITTVTYEDGKIYATVASEMAKGYIADSATTIELSAFTLVKTAGAPAPGPGIDDTADINTAPLYAVLVLGLAVVAFASKKRFAK